MRSRFWVALVGFVASVAMSLAASSQAVDYRGKTVRIVVGASAGGGYDREARLLARHLTRHLPGSPRMVVDDVPGAGGLIAANTLARATPPDGLTLGYFPLAVLLAQLVGHPAIQYDIRKFEIVGAPYADRTVCVFPTSTGITSVDRWRGSSRPLKLGSTGRESVMHVFPSLLAETLGLRSQVVNGYKGATEVRLAIASGELDGACLGWGGVKAGWPDRREIAVVVQSGTEPHRELPDVPLAVSFAREPGAVALLGDTMGALSAGARIYVFPPRTPVAIRSAMTAALLATARDPAYARDAGEAGISNDPIDGAVLRARIESLLAVPGDVRAHLRQTLAR
jgi:tripartite-type tricarboxylate transporter receptor subunit TctC